MKRIVYIAGFLLFSSTVLAQEVEEQGDTTRVNLGKVQVLIVEAGASDGEDTVIVEKVGGDRHNEAHWAGLDFGFNVVTDGSFGQTFPGEPYLANDIARSQVWNLNILEHKFKIVKEYVGFTT